jgi:hypothetical protein
VSLWEGQAHVGRLVSWDEQLFSLLDDLEQQAEAAFDAERDLELADRSRAEYAQVSLASRLMASLDHDLVLEVLGVGRIEGALQRVGTGWCLLHGRGQDWIVRHEAIALVHDASRRSVPEVAWSPVTRLGLGSALRRLADAGERCLFHIVDASHHDLLVTRVGQDFVEGRAVDGRAVLVAYPALSAVQSRE